jgi:predicted NAD/FAD-binding protein
MPVKGIRRLEHGVSVRLADNTEAVYDRVIMAAHADEALQLLEDPSADEKRLLSPWSYSVNQTYLHTDAALMPPDRLAWASWNYSREPDNTGKRPVTVTYHMNRLQKLNASRDYFVTLNPNKPIPDHHIIKKITYTHPQYSFDAFSTQKDLRRLNGQRDTYFCGSYFGYGFHEDGVKSALDVAKHFGLAL